MGLVGVADNVRDAGESGEFFGSALGVTAGDDDARSGIAGVDFADGFAGLEVGRRGNGAGIHDDVVGGIRRPDRSAAAFEKLAFDGGAVSLRGAAAELLDKERRHGVFSVKNEFTTQRTKASERTRKRSS